MRTLLRSHRLLALGLIATALAVKALVPQGYMIAPEKGFTVVICTGTGPAAMMLDLGKDAPVPAKAQDSACAYAGLTKLALAGADLVLLLAAIAFVLALGIAPITPPQLRRAAWLHPPLRGPPTLA